MGKTAIAIDLTAIERRELESLASRRKTAQGLAQRARIVLLAAEGEDNKDISVRLGAAPNTWANGGGGSRSCAWMVFTTSLVPARRVGSAMTRSPRSSVKRSRRRRRARPTGACARWPKPQASRPRRSIGSGKRSILSPIGPKPSNSPPTLCLSRKCAISSGSICRRRSGRWRYASTRTARFRRSIEHSPWLPDAPRPSRAAHARLRASRNAQPVSPLSTRRPALSSGVAIPVIADASS
jgi:hypothetical protein